MPSQRKPRTLHGRRHPRRGAMLVLVAVCLVAIIGIVALAIDGGALFEERRSVQAAADAAALAAATDLFSNYYTYNGLDTKGTGKSSALATAKANGFNNDGVTSTVTVNIPPASGIAANKAAYAEVIIQANQSRAFSKLFGSGTVPVQFRSVAYGHPAGVGVYLLDSNDPQSLDVEGNVQVLDNSVIHVNASNANTAFVSGNGNLTCGGINVVGTAQIQGTVTYTGGGSLTQHASAQADPLTSVPEPSPSGTNYNDVQYTSDTTINPGIYHNITIKGCDITMNPGVYYIEGGLQFQTVAAPPPPPHTPPSPPIQGTLTGSGVMIYNTSGDNLHFDQAGAVNLSAPTTGPYMGIVLYQPRSSSQEIHIESSNNITMCGTLYAQNGEFDIRPDGASTVFYFGSYVAQDVELCPGNDQKNNSNGTIIFDPSAGTPTQRPKLVE